MVCSLQTKRTAGLWCLQAFVILGIGMVLLDELQVRFQGTAIRGRGVGEHRTLCGLQHHCSITLLLHVAHDMQLLLRSW